MVEAEMRSSFGSFVRHLHFIDKNESRVLSTSAAQKKIGWRLSLNPIYV